MGVNPALASTLAALFQQAQQQPGQAPAVPGTAMPTATPPAGGGGGLPPSLPVSPSGPTMPPTGQYAGAGMGPTNAPQPQPQPGGGTDLNSIIQQQAQMGMQGVAARSAQSQAISKSLLGGPGAPGLIEQQQQQSGNLAFHPNMVHGQGFRGFLHNLGQAIMTAGVATPEGAAIDRVAHSRQRSEYSGRAQQIQSLMGEQREIESGIPAEAGLAYKPFSAQAQNTRAEALQERVKVYSQDVANKLLIATRGLNIKAIEAGDKGALAQARATLDRVIAEQAPARTAIMQEGVELGAATKDAIENVKAAMGVQASHPLAVLLDEIAGTHLTPAAPQTDTGKTGTGATVPPARPGAAAKHGGTPKRPAGVPANTHFDQNTQRWVEN
jgi:hypothetical protein